MREVSSKRLLRCYTTAEFATSLVVEKIKKLKELVWVYWNWNLNWEVCCAKKIKFKLSRQAVEILRNSLKDR